MKNIIKKFGIAAMVAIIGFSMAALSLTSCDTGSSGDGGNPTSKEYSAGDYKLVITQGARAAYTPQDGDTYVLTIISTGQKSTGTVTISESGSEMVFTLTPSVPGASPFTITISNGEIESISGTITCEDGNPAETPKMIKITGITLSVGKTKDKDTDGQACIHIYDTTDPKFGYGENSGLVAREIYHSLKIKNGQLLIDLYESDENGNEGKKRWTGSGPYYIWLGFAAYDGFPDDGAKGEMVRCWWTDIGGYISKYDIQDAVTTIAFSEFKKEGEETKLGTP